MYRTRTQHTGITRDQHQLWHLLASSLLVGYYDLEYPSLLLFPPIYLFGAT